MNKTPLPFECFKTCSDYASKIVFNRIHHVCGQCGLIISSLVDCPKENPYKEEPKKKKKYRSQTVDEMKHQQRMAAMIRNARKVEVDKDGRIPKRNSKNIPGREKQGDNECERIDLESVFDSSRKENSPDHDC